MSISGITTGAGALGNLLLVTPNSTVGYQPQDESDLSENLSFTKPALLFNYEGENTVSLESDITDHWTENNSAIQDQIALKPIVITTQGFIGELNNLPPNSVFAAAQAIANKLTGVSAYAPGLSATALLAYNEAVFAYTTALSLANSAISAYSSISGAVGGGSGASFIGNDLKLTKEPAQSQQQQYFQLFFGYWTQRTLFTVQTPWAVFENMAIKSLKAIQSAETRMITDFEVSFKQINYAAVTTEAELYSNTSEFSSILAGQASSKYNLGVFAVTPSSSSYTSLLGK